MSYSRFLCVVHFFHLFRQLSLRGEICQVFSKLNKNAARATLMRLGSGLWICLQDNLSNEISYPLRMVIETTGILATRGPPVRRRNDIVSSFSTVLSLASLGQSDKKTRYTVIRSRFALARPSVHRSRATKAADVTDGQEDEETENLKNYQARACFGWLNIVPLYCTHIATSSPLSRSDPSTIQWSVEWTRKKSTQRHYYQIVCLLV